MIDAAVTNVEDLSSLEEYLASLGRKHRAVGVKLSSFSVGKGALSLSKAPGLRPPLSLRPLLSTCSSFPLLYPQMTGAGACIVVYLLCDPGTALTSLSLQFFFSGMVSLRTIGSGGAFGISWYAQFYIAVYKTIPEQPGLKQWFLISLGSVERFFCSTCCGWSHACTALSWELGWGWNVQDGLSSFGISLPVASYCSIV